MQYAQEMNIIIDEAATLKRFGYTSEEWGRTSKKLIVVVCNDCKESRVVFKGSYRDKCISCAQMGKKVSDETRQKLSTINTGKHHSEETKRKISELNRNRSPISEETRRKMSEASKGRKHSEETKRKMSRVQKGKHVSDETRAKQREAWKNRSPVSEETKQKIGNAHIGRRNSEETKLRMSVAATTRYEDPKEREKASAIQQGILYEDWEGFATKSPYCPKFDEKCRESNREKYGRRCFLTDLPEAENGQKLSVHHVDMDRMQGCDGRRWRLVPLCKAWHAHTHNDLWEARIGYLLENVWAANPHKLRLKHSSNR